MRDAEIDIVDVKVQILMGLLNVYVKDNKIYMSNKIGETVEIGEIKTEV